MHNWVATATNRELISGGLDNPAQYTHYWCNQSKNGCAMSAVDFMLSERQQRMLGALLIHPDRQYGSNELIAIGGPGYGAGRRVLEQFEQSGIVVKSARGNQRLYSVNSEHPIYPDLRSICFKTFGMSEVITKELASFKDRIKLAFVFGSTVQGTELPGSDVDLMVVGSVDVFEIGLAIERIQKIVGREVDLYLHTPEEWRALESDHVIKAILKSEKIMVFGQ